MSLPFFKASAVPTAGNAVVTEGHVTEIVERPLNRITEQASKMHAIRGTKETKDCLETLRETVREVDIILHSNQIKDEQHANVAPQAEEPSENTPRFF